MELSHEQDYALDLFKDGQNLLITGPGGVGKTHLIHKFIDYSNHVGRNVQVCALTGCASLLLGCSAKTIHSWSGIKLAKGAKKQIIDRAMKSKGIKQRWKSIRVLIIDEVSMMSKKIFDVLEELARLMKHSQQPFGGIQLIMSGDFYQLPPIGDPNEPSTGQFCFESQQWLKVIPWDNHIELNTMFRQKDPKYIEILSQIRQGTLSPENEKLLEGHVGRTYNPDENNGIVISKIFPVRSRVDYVNRLMFEKLDTPIESYLVEKIQDCCVYVESGAGIETHMLDLCKQLSMTEREREINNMLANTQCLEHLDLKIGAAVMCTANIDIENGICNGSQGIIKTFVGEHKIPQVRFTNGLTMLLPKHKWQSPDYPSIVLSQYPLQLAWALTIHKIQGATLGMAQIDIGSSIFEYGQTYVAMSRIKSLDGLYLSGFNAKKIRANPTVIAFYKMIPEIEYVEALDELPQEPGDYQDNTEDKPEKDKPETHYEVLGIDETANLSEIKRAYHILILLYHPDKSLDVDSVDKFRKVQEAYEVVGGSGKNKYDLDLMMNRHRRR